MFIGFHSHQLVETILFYRGKKKKNQEYSVLYKFILLIMKIGELHLVKFWISLELSPLDGLIYRNDIGNTICYILLSDELLGATGSRNLFWLPETPEV